MRSMKNSCWSCASVTALAGGWWAVEPRSNGACFRSVAIGPTSSFGTGDGFSVVMSQMLRGLQVEIVFDVNASALIGRVICFFFHYACCWCVSHAIPTNSLNCFAFC